MSFGWNPLTNIIQQGNQVSDDTSDDEPTEKPNNHESTASTSKVLPTVTSALDGLPNDMAYSQ